MNVRVVLRVALVTAAVALSPMAKAKAPDEAGWWWRAQQGQSILPVPLPVPLPPLPFLPAPPNVEEGQLHVSSAPDEPLAIAAVRFVLPSEERADSLTLREADSGNADAIRLEACAATSRWFPAEAGPWSERPEYDCALGRAAGTRSADGSWQFDVAELLVEGTLDVVIVPVAPDDGTPAAPAFVTFAQPGEDALSTTAVPPDEEPFVEEPFVDEQFGEFTSGPFDLPADIGAVNEAAAARVFTPPRIAPPLAAAQSLPERDANRAGLAALLLFAACAAAASRLGREREHVLLHAPHLLRGRPGTHGPGGGGGGGDPVVAGVARFTRPRTGTPPPLN